MKKEFIGSWLALFAGVTITAQGSPERFRAPAELMKQSPLVFEGEVTSIRYRDAAPNDANSKGQPFTFVEYRVLTPIRGNVGQTFTLRFWGGLSADDSYMVAGNTPQFDVGDRDVLFVKGNSTVACPLASCEAGRFRIIGDKVYLDGGRTLRFKNGKTATAGAPQKLKEVLTQTLVSRKTGKSVEVRTDGASGVIPSAEADQFRGGQFVTYLRQLAKASAAPAGSEVSANIASQLVGYTLPGKSPRQPAPMNEPAGNAADQAEMKAYIANSGNPVLPKKE